MRVVANAAVAFEPVARSGEDEFERVGVEREPSLTVRPPRVRDSPVAIECRLERTIEFLAQVFQLIRGGRELELRDRSTRRTLDVLAQKRLLGEQEV